VPLVGKGREKKDFVCCRNLPVRKGKKKVKMRKAHARIVTEKKKRKGQVPLRCATGKRATKK